MRIRVPPGVLKIIINMNFFKIKISGDPARLSRAKKLVSAGLAKGDGVAIYRTLSFSDKESVGKYLEECGVEFESIVKLAAR